MIISTKSKNEQNYRIFRQSGAINEKSMKHLTDVNAME